MMTLERALGDANAMRCSVALAAAVALLWASSAPCADAIPRYRTPGGQLYLGGDPPPGSRRIGNEPEPVADEGAASEGTAPEIGDARPVAREPLQAKAARVLELFASSRFDEAALLFAYPASETGSVLATSRHDVSAALRRLSQRLGELHEYRPVRDPGKVLAVGVGGGLPPDGLRYVMNIDYTASFEKVLDARLRLQFVQGQDEWQVGSFSFGVPQSQPNAQELLADVLRVMQP